MTAPRLSIVAVSRNDNHGGDLTRRMQIFVSGLLEQARRHKLNAELILVEWNPPADRPPLAEALVWPKEPGPCAVRIITVPHELHRRFRSSGKLPLYQMIAKNVGILRSRGEFVLATNIDLLFSDELISALASQALDRDALYRIDRTDVAADVPADEPLDRQFEYCRNHVLRHNRRDLIMDARTGAVMMGDDAAPGLRRGIAELFDFRRVDRPTRLHTNGCGDFTLLSRDRWFQLRGYAELEMYSMHIDTLLLHAAAAAGAREHVFAPPAFCWHIEHGTGSGFTPYGEGRLNRRLDAAGIRRLESPEVDAWCLHMRRSRKPMQFNGPDWGLAGANLNETLPMG